MSPCLHAISQIHSLFKDICHQILIALDLEVFGLTPKETVLGIFSDESSLQKIVPFLFLVARNYIHSCKWTLSCLYILFSTSALIFSIFSFCLTLILKMLRTGFVSVHLQL
jgi:hypothetical protein